MRKSTAKVSSSGWQIGIYPLMTTYLKMSGRLAKKMPNGNFVMAISILNVYQSYCNEKQYGKIDRLLDVDVSPLNSNLRKQRSSRPYSFSFLNSDADQCNYFTWGLEASAACSGLLVSGNERTQKSFPIETALYTYCFPPPFTATIQSCELSLDDNMATCWNFLAFPLPLSPIDLPEMLFLGELLGQAQLSNAS